MKKYARKCDECNKVMNEGYYWGCEYYCSLKCLKRKYTDEEIEDALNNYEDCYWTSWEDPEEYQYYENGDEIDE